MLSYALILRQVYHKSLLILIFLIYINDLSEGVTANVMPFTDDNFLFSVFDGVHLSVTNFNSELSKKCLRKSMENEL